MRGPGWYWFWPWEVWDPHKTVAISNVNLTDWGVFKFLGNPKVLGVELLGLFLVNGYILAPTVWVWHKYKNAKGTIQQMGFVRYLIVSQLFLIMMGLPIKMFLRLVLNIKYVWVTPWFNI